MPCVPSKVCMPRVCYLMHCVCVFGVVFRGGWGWDAGCRCVHTSAHPSRHRPWAARHHPARTRRLWCWSQPTTSSWPSSQSLLVSVRLRGHGQDGSLTLLCYDNTSIVGGGCATVKSWAGWKPDCSLLYVRSVSSLSLLQLRPMRGGGSRPPSSACWVSSSQSKPRESGVCVRLKFMITMVKPASTSQAPWRSGLVQHRQIKCIRSAAPPPDHLISPCTSKPPFLSSWDVCPPHPAASSPHTANRGTPCTSRVQAHTHTHTHTQSHTQT